MLLKSGSINEGLMWLEHSAELGDRYAALELADIYGEGQHGLQIDGVRANQYFEVANRLIASRSQR